MNQIYLIYAPGKKAPCMAFCNTYFRFLLEYVQMPLATDLALICYLGMRISQWRFGLWHYSQPLIWILNCLRTHLHLHATMAMMIPTRLCKAKKLALNKPPLNFCPVHVSLVFSHMFVGPAWFCIEPCSLWNVLFLLELIFCSSAAQCTFCSAWINVLLCSCPVRSDVWTSQT